MYKRDIHIPSASPVLNGKPLQGTWVRPFEKVNLLDIQKPFSLPLPKLIVGLRIKEWQSFIIQNDDIFFESIICNLKFFRYIEAAFVHKKNKTSKYYFDYFPFSIWKLPDSLLDNFFNCDSAACSASIHNHLNESKVKYSINITAPLEESSLEAAFELNLDARKTLPLVTNLLFAEKRPVYSYKNIGSASGTLRIDGTQHYEFDSSASAALFFDCKGLFPYIFSSRSINCSGFLQDGRFIGFSMVENNARAPNKDNENVLWLEGSTIPLPPVKITHPFGISNEWIIQDVEGMVDLEFKPHSQSDKRGLDMIFIRGDFYYPFGSFNGTISAGDGCGDKIKIQGLFGCAKDLYLRL